MPWEQLVTIFDAVCHIFLAEFEKRWILPASAPSKDTGLRFLITKGKAEKQETIGQRPSSRALFLRINPPPEEPALPTT